VTHRDIPMDTSAEELFPQFQRLQSMVSEEVADLTDQQLDWRSDQWDWSKWSIRQQVGHIGTLVPGWLLRRWGDQLFPEGTSELGEIAEYSWSPTGPWLNEEEYKDIPALLRKVGHGMSLARHVLSKETVGSMLAKEVARPDTPPHWRRFIDCHPTGVRWHPTEPNFTYLTLDATFRHLYYEVITHLYNVQRLKRAQGLSGVLELPREGYWVLPDWDRSEP
jgi:hypothetical protein